MADRELLELLDDPESWRRWRIENPSARPDLERADLHRKKLAEVNLEAAHMVGANLDMADLDGANLGGANLDFGSLEGTDLGGANLEGTNLHRAQLIVANLRGTSLVEANLVGANLVGSNLRGANLEAADLRGANLEGADLDGANLRGARLGRTVLADLDLRRANGLTEVNHEARSSLGVDTLYRSQGEIPVEFLRGCGVPSVMVDYIPSLTAASVLDFYSCFISYSHADNAFAERLYGDLFHRHKVSCWKDDHALSPGDKLDVEIDKAIRSVDKVVLVCSEAVLAGPTGSWWVDREVTRALQEEERLSRERNEHVTMLVPVDLDGYLDSPECTYHRAADLRERVSAPFRGWQSDEAIYSEGVDRVLRALRAGGPGGVILPQRKL